MKRNTTLLYGTLFAGLGVALGAFGAHALKATLLANNRLEAYETAVRYQMYHAFALLVAGILMSQLRWAANCWVGGIVLFSGSLYALSFTTVTAFAFLTPVGGLLFLAGWSLMAIAVLTPNPSP